MFTSKERDSETGLDWFEARYFSSAQGRFTSPDEPLVDQSPYDPQSWNLYGYVRNNPLRFVDPTGRCSQAPGGSGYVDDGSGIFPGPCSGGTIGDSGKPALTVGVGADEANRIAAEQLYEQFTSPHQWADLVSHAGQAAGAVLAPGATAFAQCATGTSCSKTGLAMAILPGALGSSGRAIRILEEVGGAVHLEVQGVKGTYEVIANISREGDTIILDGAHMQGSGGGQFGGKELLKEIREAAKQFGKEQGAKEVVIQGGARTSGANPGHTPPPIRIRVQ